MLVLENGKTLRQTRQKTKIPVKTLAEMLGVCESRVYAIEKADETSYTLVMKYLNCCYDYEARRVSSEE